MTKLLIFLYGLVFAKACDEDIDKTIDKVGKIVDENLPTSQEKLLIGQWNSVSTFNDVEEIDGEQVSISVQFSCKTEYFPTKTFNDDCEMVLSFLDVPVKMSFDVYMTGTWELDERYLYNVSEDLKMNLTSIQIEKQIISDSEKIRQIQKEMFGGEKIEDVMPKKDTTKSEILKLEQTRLVTQEEWDEQLITVNATRSQ